MEAWARLIKQVSWWECISPSPICPWTPWTPLGNKSLEGTLWPICSLWNHTFSRPGASPSKETPPPLFSVREREVGEREEKLCTGLKGEEAELSAGCSPFCFVFIFKLWRGEKKSQWGVSFYFYFSLLFFSPPIQRWAVSE